MSVDNFSLVRMRAYLMIIHGLEDILDALKIFNANKSRRHRNTHISRPNSSVSFRSTNNYDISRAERAIVSPARTQKRSLVTSFDRHSISSERLCSTIPDAVEQFVVRMKVS